jgi:hypothetical protein
VIFVVEDAFVSERKANKSESMICNPLDINYRLCMNEHTRRETIDSSVIVLEGDCCLFASKSVCLDVPPVVEILQNKRKTSLLNSQWYDILISPDADKYLKDIPA